MVTFMCMQTDGCFRIARVIASLSYLAYARNTIAARPISPECRTAVCSVAKCPPPDLFKLGISPVPPPPLSRFLFLFLGTCLGLPICTYLVGS